MKGLITLTFIVANLIVQSQTIDMVLIGDNQAKAKKIVKEMADLDSYFEFEEYIGWYDGINDFVNQYSIWGDDMLFKHVFVVNGKVAMIVTFSSEPPANTSQAKLDDIKKKLRSKDCPSDLMYLRDDTYKVMIDNKFYCYRKHLVIYMFNKKEIQPYIIDAVNFDALQRYTDIWESMIKNDLRYRYF
jgi:hypothetical protein